MAVRVRELNAPSPLVFAYLSYHTVADAKFRKDIWSIAFCDFNAQVLTCFWRVRARIRVLLGITVQGFVLAVFVGFLRCRVANYVVLKIGNS